MRRQDYDLAARKLELARDNVLATNANNQGRQAARLFEFTQIVFNDPLVSKSLEEILRSRPMNLDNLQESWRAAHVPPLAADIAELWPQLEVVQAKARLLPPIQDDQIGEFLAMTLWDDSHETLAEKLQRLNTSSEAEALSIAQLGSLNSKGFSKILHWLERLAEHMDKNEGEHTRLVCDLRQKTGRLEAHIDKLKSLIAKATSDENLLRPFCEAHVIQPAVNRFREFHDEAQRALQPVSSLPLPHPNASGLSGEVEFLSSLLLEQLGLGPARWYVLDRLQTYMEHFAFEDLTRRLRKEEDDAKSRSNGKAQREDILQDEIDRFVFLDGFYPITHCEAGRGKLDTLIDLYRDVDSKQQRPLLIELKQMVNVHEPASITENNVQRAVDDARDQAKRYANHIRANTAWRDVEPVVLLVHNCQNKIEIDGEGDDVVIIYLGEDTPSRKRRRNKKTS